MIPFIIINLTLFRSKILRTWFYNFTILFFNHYKVLLQLTQITYAEIFACSLLWIESCYTKRIMRLEINFLKNQIGQVKCADDKRHFKCRLECITCGADIFSGTEPTIMRLYGKIRVRENSYSGRFCAVQVLHITKSQEKLSSCYLVS